MTSDQKNIGTSTPETATPTPIATLAHFVGALDDYTTTVRVGIVDPSRVMRIVTDIIADRVRLADALREKEAECERLQQRVNELEADDSDWKDAERWRLFRDAAEMRTSSNGDNTFVQYTGPDVAAYCKCNEEDGTVWTPGTPDEWIDQLIDENRRLRYTLQGQRASWSRWCKSSTASTRVTK